MEVLHGRGSVTVGPPPSGRSPVHLPAQSRKTGATPRQGDPDRSAGSGPPRGAISQLPHPLPSSPLPIYSPCFSDRRPSTHRLRIYSSQPRLHSLPPRSLFNSPTMRSSTVAVLAAVTAASGALAATDRTTWTGEAQIEDAATECESFTDLSRWSRAGGRGDEWRGRGRRGDGWWNCQRFGC